MWNFVCKNKRITISNDTLMILDNLKILQCIFDSFHFLRCRMFPRLFQFFYRIRSVIHRQAQTSLYLCYISSMYLETIFSFYVFLYLFVCNSLFRLVRFGSLYDIIQRYFSLTLTKLNFYVDMSVWLFVGKQYYRLNVRWDGYFILHGERLAPLFRYRMPNFVFTPFDDFLPLLPHLK